MVPTVETQCNETVIQNKVRKLNPKKEYLAPYFQLAWGYKKDLIGRDVEIFEVDGGFLVKISGEEFKQPVASNLEERISILEEKIKHLIRLHSQEYNQIIPNSSKGHCCYGDFD